MIRAQATATFVHGEHSLKRGDIAEFTEPTFVALAAHGLVREAEPEQAATQASQRRSTRAARTPVNKNAPAPLNKGTESLTPAIQVAAPTLADAVVPGDSDGSQADHSAGTAQDASTTNTEPQNNDTPADPAADA